MEKRILRHCKKTGLAPSATGNYPFTNFAGAAILLRNNKLPCRDMKTRF
jgi:hypothetical protein